MTTQNQNVCFKFFGSPPYHQAFEFIDKSSETTIRFPFYEPNDTLIKSQQRNDGLLFDGNVLNESFRVLFPCSVDALRSSDELGRRATRSGRSVAILLLLHLPPGLLDDVRALVLHVI